VEDVLARRATPAFRNALREVAGWARGLFQEGLPLARMVDRRLAIDVELFSRGGMRILDKIAASGYDVLSRRPAVSRGERVWLLLTTMARAAFSKAA
jgi:phytoene/squalene synthetase